MKYLINWILTMTSGTFLYYITMKYCAETGNWLVLPFVIMAVSYLQWSGFTGDQS